jgi:hypothetical protein
MNNPVRQTRSLCFPWVTMDPFLRRSGFGGWPWATDDPVHPPSAGRFASHPGGRSEHPE